MKLEGHQQNLSLGMNPIDNAEPCYPHDNMVGSQCDECMKSNEHSVTDRASLFTDQ